MSKYNPFEDTGIDLPQRPPERIGGPDSSVYADNVFKKIEYERTRSVQVGGLRVVIGQLSWDKPNGPRIIGAELSGEDLANEACGYGATENEDVADLFRLMRPQR